MGKRKLSKRIRKVSKRKSVMSKRGGGLSKRMNKQRSRLSKRMNKQRGWSKRSLLYKGGNRGCRKKNREECIKDSNCWYCSEQAGFFNTAPRCMKLKNAKRKCNSYYFPADTIGQESKMDQN